MRKIRELPISQETRTANRSEWDPQRQRLLSIGLGIVFFGLLVAGAFQYLRSGLDTKIPELANLEGVNQEVDSQPIDELFEIWKERVRTSELAEPVPNQIVLDKRTDRRYFGLVIGGLVVALAGGAMATWVFVGFPKSTAT